ncbi:MAG: hypothetical protein EPN79_04615 [Burkholderiaceae bacterium]|nr:MAG: hypothetical protein EPN79_04615 [Burkholderiaceae bacterium]TBR76919.1 MAG: hypothetical protein EPN64_05125 [Burkholderiaceae bacterium]
MPNFRSPWSETTSHTRVMSRRLLLASGSAAAAAALIAGCKSAPERAPERAPSAAPGAPPRMPPPSNATTARAYRLDAARHLYALNADRIYQGKMPPLLYAIGVLQVDIGGRGQVLRMRWMRAPTQAPEVMVEIERTVRQAAPFPVPLRLGKVTYTDVWLWDKSGRFQLDTLTEGQLGAEPG